MAAKSRRPKEKGRTGKGRLGLLLGWIGVGGVLVAALAVRIPPDATPWPALGGLAFPISAILLMFGVLTALRRKRWWTLMGLLAAVLWTLPLFVATWGCGGCEGQGPEDAPGLKVMSWNVRLFDYYDWLRTEGAPAGQVKADIMAAIAGGAPDVLCLQEFMELEDGRRFPVQGPLDVAMGGSAPEHHVVIARSREGRRFGVATWSRWPIVGRSSIAFGTRKNNVCAVTDIDWDGERVRVFNAHFSSLRFEREDYAALEEGVPDAEGRERIWGHMRSAYVERVRQVEAVMAEVERSPYPVILCGDFNDTPTSWALARCRASLEDTHDRRWFRLDGTWEGPIPGVRIDHILCSPTWKVRSHETGGAGLSDHRFVTAELVAGPR